MSKKTPEGAILKSILEYLAVKKIWHRRMNSGAVKTEGGGFMRFGTPGMADILASYDPTAQEGFTRDLPYFLWIEVKATNGIQSAAQKEFQTEIEKEGHYYLIARSIEDVEAWISRNS